MQGNNELSVLISARDELSAKISSANASLRTFEGALQTAYESARRMGDASSGVTRAIEAQIASIKTSVGAWQEQKAAIDAQIGSLQGLESAVNRVSLAFARVGVGTLASVTKELETQLQVTRQLGERASTYGSIQAAQLSTVLAARQAESDALRRGASEENAANLERQKYVSTIAPQSNVAERRRLDKDLFDSETAGFQRVAAAQTAASALMLTNLRRYQTEQAKVAEEQIRFQERMSARVQTGQYGGVFPRSFAPARELGTAEQQANLAVSEVRESMMGGAVAANALGAGMRNAAGGARTASLAAKEVSVAYDELRRGQFGQFMASLGADLRQAGVGTAALFAGVGALVGFGVVESLHRMAISAGELAEKTLTAASAAGASVEQYSQLAGVMQMAGGKTDTLDRALEVMSQRLDKAIADLGSQERTGFIRLGLGDPAWLEQALRNPIAALEELRQKFQSLPEDGQRTAQFIQALGNRDFRVLEPIITKSTANINDFAAAVERAGGTRTKEFEERLAAAARAEQELSIATQRLKDEFSTLMSGSGLSGFFTMIVEGWGNIFNRINEVIGKVKEFKESISTQFTMPTAQALGLALGGPAGANLAGAIAGAMGAGKQPEAPTQLPPAAVPVPGTGQSQLSSFAAPSAHLGGFNTVVQARLEAWLDSLTEEEKAHLKMTSAVRTAAEQAAIKAREPGGIAAQPGGSAHQYAIGSDWSGLTESAAAKLKQFGLHQPVPGDFPHIEPIETPSASTASAEQRRASFQSLTAPGGALYAPASVQAPAAATSGLSDDRLAGLRAINEAMRAEVRSREDQIKLIEAQQKQESSLTNDKTKQLAIDQDAAQKRKALEDEIAAIKDRYHQVAIAQKFTEQQISEHLPGVDTTSQQVGKMTVQTQVNEAQRAALNQQFQNATQAADLQIAEARRAAQAVIDDAKSSTTQKIQAEETYKSQVASILSGLEAQSRTIYNQEGAKADELARRRVDLERQADAEISRLRKQTIQDLERDATRAERQMRVDTKSIEVGIEAQKLQTQQTGGGGIFSGGQAIYQREVAGAKAAIAAIEQWEQTALKAAQAVVDAGRGAQAGSQAAKDAADAELKLKEVRTQAAQEELQIIQKLQQSWSQMNAGVSSFINQLGSTFSSGLGNVVKAIIAPQVEIIHAGLTTITHTNRGQQIAAAIAQMLTSAIEGAAKMVGSAAMNAIGNMLLKGVSGTDFSAKLSNWLTQAITGQAPATATSLGATSLTGSTGVTTAITAGATAATPAITTSMSTAATAAIPAMSAAFASAASAGSAGGAVGGGLGLFKLLGFEGGGIVSAAGGMTVGGIGALAMLHPREMVLPAHISESVQNMANQGGGSRTTHSATNVNYSPTINAGRTNLSRSDFASLLSQHLPSVVGDLRTMIRQGYRG